MDYARVVLNSLGLSHLLPVNFDRSCDVSLRTPHFRATGTQDPDVIFGYTTIINIFFQATQASATLLRYVQASQASSSRSPYVNFGSRSVLHLTANASQISPSATSAPKQNCDSVGSFATPDLPPDSITGYNSPAIPTSQLKSQHNQPVEPVLHDAASPQHANSSEASRSLSTPKGDNTSLSSPISTHKPSSVKLVAEAPVIHLMDVEPQVVHPMLSTTDTEVKVPPAPVVSTWWQPQIVKAPSNQAKTVAAFAAALSGSQVNQDEEDPFAWLLGEEAQQPPHKKRKTG